MSTTVDRKGFRKLFEDRTINVNQLRPDSPSRQAAEKANDYGDANVRTKQEFERLFDGLDRDVDRDGVAGQLTLRDDTGNLTAVGKQVERYLEVARSKRDFFDAPMHLVDVQGWPGDQLRPTSKSHAPDGALLRILQIDPHSNLHLPPPGADGVEFATADFSLKNSGNFTLHAPKPSWKFEFEGKGNDVHGMAKLNAKAEYNDPSNMRQTLAYDLLRAAGVPASRTTFARVGVNGQYRGLHTLIEQVDKEFLKDHFGKNDQGNLYKGYWTKKDGAASLSYRRGADGDDSGRQYTRHGRMDDRAYRLQTNDKDPALNNYNDLARFVRTINGVDLPGGPEKFNTKEYAESVKKIFNVEGFLRWASTNMLLGGWDNYYATPANYYLYNSGKKGAADEFVDKPYFNWIPWDHDNTFGLDMFKTKWHEADILDFGKNTKNYYGRKKQAEIPLLDNLLKNDSFRQYYLDHMEHMLDTEFNPDKMQKKLDGLWDRVSQSGYLESDTEHGPAHTGRGFSNHEFYQAGHEQWELQRGNTKIEGIIHFVRMRHDSARRQLAELRHKYPRGASGATFDGKEDKLPKE